MVGYTDVMSFDGINVGLVFKLVEMCDILDRNSKEVKKEIFPFLPLYMPWPLEQIFVVLMTYL